MRILLTFVLLIPLAAQEAKQEPAPKPEAPTAPAASPVPSTESWLTGSVDLGYRWRTAVAGSLDEYRSVVDLGSGPKLLGAEFTIQPANKRFFDSIHVRGYNWGDDPYSSVHVNARKERMYEFNTDYRNIAYFNNVPSFADPLLARGIVLNERSFDMRRRFSDFQLDLLPGNWINPYLAYGRNSGSGNGVTTFVVTGNEYPVPDLIRDSMNNYRAGIRFELRHFHVTVEQGGTTFHDDQQVFSAPGTRNLRNNTTPLLGQTLFLSSLQQAYGIRGSSIYSKALFTANPWRWIDVYGQFLYSEPHSDVNYQQFDTGNFALLNPVLVYTGQQFFLSAASKLPHTSESLGVEIRPFRRVRIRESWLTDRLHNATSSQARQVLTPVSSTQPQLPFETARLTTNYSQEEIIVLFDLTKHLMLRGGYRYVWGDATSVVSPLAGLLLPDSGTVRRNVGIVGFSFRPNTRLLISADVEGASSGSAYFHTSLRDYQKVHGRANYQVSTALTIAADLSVLNNQNTAGGVPYDYLAQASSVSFIWSPKAAKRFSIQGDYTRSAIRSDISYLAPQDLQPQRCFYRDNAHLGGLIVDVALPAVGKIRASTFSGGGSLFISSGSRPTSYFHPVAKLSLPVTAHVSWVSDWHYYGFGEAFYTYEAFRTHVITTGLRVTR
jgi:hypothetical protein